MSVILKTTSAPLNAQDVLLVGNVHLFQNDERDHSVRSQPAKIIMISIIPLEVEIVLTFTFIRIIYTLLHRNGEP